MKQIESIFGITISDSEVLYGDVNYNNQKFKITDSLGRKYVLKIYSDEDEWALAKEESDILEKIGKFLSFKVPQNIKSIEGNHFSNYGEANAKLLGYIEGSFIADVPPSEKLLFHSVKRSQSFPLPCNLLKAQC